MSRAFQASSSLVEAMMQDSHCGLLLENSAGFVTQVNEIAAEVFGSPDANALKGRSNPWLLQQLAQRADDPSELDALKDVDEYSKGSFFIEGEQVLWSVLSLDVDGQAMRLWRFAAQLRPSQAPVTKNVEQDFLASMSHELRTPLNAILGMSDLLLSSTLSPGQRPLAEIIQSNADSLLSIINDILDYSKIIAGQIDLVAAPFSLADLLASVEDMLSMKAAAKGLELSFVADPMLPSRFLGDAGRLQQILVNLCNNALKFTKVGRVMVRAELLGPEEGGEVPLGLVVEDTGIGIGEQEQEQVFNKFFRSQSRSVQETSGTGLGLHIVSSIVAQMKGEIELTSELGVGTRIEIVLTLPVVNHAADESSRLTQLNHQIQQTRLLLLTDEKGLCGRVGRILRERGFSFEVASSEELDGLHQYIEERISIDELSRNLMHLDRFDGILYDVNLGEGYFYELSAFSSGLPTLLLASSSQLNTRLAQASGVRAVVSVPVRESQLMDALLKLIRVRGEPALSTPKRSRKRLILLAEDNPDNQVYARTVLAKAGYRVEIAGDGGAAVEMAAATPFDLILMDVQMPVMDGFEATRQIRERERWAAAPRTPIVALTGHALEGFRERCLENGMDDYVTKPVRQNTLLRIAEEWADTRARVLLTFREELDTELAAYFKAKGCRVVQSAEIHAGISLLWAQRPEIALFEITGLTQSDALRQVFEQAHDELGTTFLARVEKKTQLDSSWREIFAGFIEPGAPAEQINVVVDALLSSSGEALLPQEEVSEASLAQDEAYLPDEPEPDSLVIDIPEDLLPIIPSFIEARHRDFATLNALFDEGKLEEIKRIGHNLKGSGASYGFMEITQLGRQLEAAARDQKVDEVRALCDAYGEYLRRLKVRGL